MKRSLLIVGNFHKEKLDAIFSHVSKSRFSKICYFKSFNDVEKWKNFSTIWVSYAEYQKNSFLKIVKERIKLIIAREDLVKLNEILSEFSKEDVIYYEPTLLSLIGVRAISHFKKHS